MALTATVHADTIQRSIGSASRDTIVKSFYPLAATKYARGDFVTIDTAGRVDNTIADDAAVDGIVFSKQDNSLGANDNTDRMVAVVVKGNIFCDFLCGATGSYDDAFAIGTQCSAQGDSGTTADEGQALVAVSGASNQLFTSLSIHALPSSGQELVKGLAFFQGSAKFA
jgi:hypothetical protein